VQYVDVGLTTRIGTSFDPADPPQYEHDGYPVVIADQRHAYDRETVEEIEAFWIETLARRNTEMWWDERKAVPYINRARWLVDCPDCNVGNYCWDRNPLACCLECGLLVKVMWQPPLVRSQAIRLLAVRPIVNANWNAHKGETVDDLEVENRWLLNEPSIEKNGLVVPVGLDVPEALEKYVDPKVR
jgi:hypothetical protein